MEQDVESPAMTEESVTQEVASPEGQASTKEYNFRALEAERDQYRKQAEEYRQLAEEKANVAAMYQQVNQQDQSAQKNEASNLGLNFDEAIDRDSFTKLGGFIGDQAQKLNEQAMMQREQIEMMELRLKDPNWRATIDKYLPDAVKEDQGIINTIKSVPNKWTTMYHFATRNMKYLQDTMSSKQNDDAKRAVQNAEKPKTLGSTGTQSNVGGHRDAFSMSDAEFADIKKQIREGTYKY